MEEQERETQAAEAASKKSNEFRGDGLDQGLVIQTWARAVKR